MHDGAKIAKVLPTSGGCSKIPPSDDGAPIDPAAQSPQFKQNYRRANCCTKILYLHGNPLISAVHANDRVMKEEMIEDMTERDGETEACTRRLIENFWEKKQAMDGKKRDE